MVRDMKKKILTVVMSLMMCFSVAACGGGEDKKKDDGIDPNATVTKEQYDKLRETKWYELTPEEMEQFLGVKYVEDEDSTESWGEGYLVVDFPGPDENSRLHVLFKADENGKYTPSSMSPTGKLMED